MIKAAQMGSRRGSACSGVGKLNGMSPSCLWTGRLGMGSKPADVALSRVTGFDVLAWATLVLGPPGSSGPGFSSTSPHVWSCISVSSFSQRGGSRGGLIRAAQMGSRRGNMFSGGGRLACVYIEFSIGVCRCGLGCSVVMSLAGGMGAVAGGGSEATGAAFSCAGYPAVPSWAAWPLRPLGPFGPGFSSTSPHVRMVPLPWLMLGVGLGMGVGF